MILPAPPALVAPAGGRAQFFAALNSGADAVYLGLERFNARARAENFSVAELAELIPVAHRFGMQVLVTTNVVIREEELPAVVELLDQLVELGVDAIVVQDLGVARLARQLFPELRLHASTQLALHDPAGLALARELGFARVVLARELTLTELARIRAELGPSGPELEVFCCGSLCTSYSGLCLLSSFESGLSGNRGECCYPCRRRYRALEATTGRELGEGCLLSMKDLEVKGELLRQLVELGVTALKIEGRKKDAQYVRTTVRLYRQRLDQLYGRSTLRDGAPAAAHPRADEPDPTADLPFSFQRRTTSLYLAGTHPPHPVLDPDQASHLGREVGRVVGIRGRWARLQLRAPLELHDGVRLEPAGPRGRQAQADGADQLGVHRLRLRGRTTVRAPAGAEVELELPAEVARPQMGDRVIQVRAADLKRRTDDHTAPPPGVRLRGWPTIELHTHLTAGPPGELQLVARVRGQEVLRLAHPLPPAREEAGDPVRSRSLAEQLTELFSVLGDAGFLAQVRHQGAMSPALPRDWLKQLKQQLVQQLPAAYQRVTADRRQAHATWLAGPPRAAGPVLDVPGTPPATPAREPALRFHLRVDARVGLEAVEQLLRTEPSADWHAALASLTFAWSPGLLRAMALTPAELVRDRSAFADWTGGSWRLSLPPVIRAGDEAGLLPWLDAFEQACVGVDAVGPAAARPGYGVNNLGGLGLLRHRGLLGPQRELIAEPFLFTANSQSVEQLTELGCTGITLSPECDRPALEALLHRWPSAGARPYFLLYGHLPVLISEACTLALLKRGCHDPEHCGREPLLLVPISDSPARSTGSTAGQLLRHEQCRSFLYAPTPFAATHLTPRLRELGVADFLIDLTGPAVQPHATLPDRLARILDAAWTGTRLPGTHPGNLERRWA